MGKFCVSKLIKPAESVFIQTENVIFELFIVCLNHSKKPGLKPCQVRELTSRGYEIAVLKSA